MSTVHWRTRVSAAASASALSIILVASLGMSATTSAQEELPTLDELHRRYEERIRPLLATYCFDCHNDALSKGGVRLDALDPRISPSTIATWTRAKDLLDVGSMPPEGETRPSPDEQVQLLEWIRDSLRRHDADHKETHGNTLIRRINNRAYATIIETLLGVPPQGMEDFPVDGTVHGFDTVGSGLHATTYLYQLYLECARRTLDAAVSDRESPPEVKEHRQRMMPEPGHRFDRNRNDLRMAIRLLRDDPAKFAALGNGIVSATLNSLMENVAAPLERMLERTLVSDIVTAHFGSVSIHALVAKNMDWAGDPACAGELITALEAQIDRLTAMEAYVSDMRSVTVLPFHVNQVGVLEPGWYIVSARMAVSNPKYPLPARLIAGDRTVDSFMVYDPPTAPRTFEAKVYWDQRWTSIDAQSVLPYGGDFSRSGFPYYYFLGHVKALYGDQLGAEAPSWPTYWTNLPAEWVAETKHAEPVGLLISETSVRGPIHDVWPTPATTRIFTRGVKAPPTREYAEEIVASFMKRAYAVGSCDAQMTRPYVDMIMSHFQAENNFVEAVKSGLAAILSSPRFLYLEEKQRDDPAKPRQLDPFELARRLAYLLWSDLPDDALLACAADGTLRDQRTLRDQTRRMLKHERSCAFRRAFASQWLKIDRLDRISYSYDQFPGFDMFLLDSAAKESVAFFSEILDKNLSILNFIESDFIMVNGRMAQHYGIPGVVGNGFRRVPLPRESHRGGVLTQASLLMTTSNGMVTSPVRRGAFVMERLLGISPGTPPPNVPALDQVVSDRPGAPPMTPSEKLALHRSNQSCSRCHHRIDPLGVGLENYNALGRWSATVSVLLNDSAKTAGAIWMEREADTRGSMLDGKPYVGPDELKQRLLEHKDRFARCLAEHLMVYSLGRELEQSDGPILDRLCADVAADGYGLASLIERLVLSDAFTHK